MALGAHIQFYGSRGGPSRTSPIPVQNRLPDQSPIGGPDGLPGLCGFQDALDLRQMIDVMSGDHGNASLHAFFAALGMLAEMLPLFRRDGFQHVERRLS